MAALELASPPPPPPPPTNRDKNSFISLLFFLLFVWHLQTLPALGVADLSQLVSNTAKEQGPLYLKSLCHEVNNLLKVLQNILCLVVEKIKLKVFACVYETT